MNTNQDRLFSILNLNLFVSILISIENFAPNWCQSWLMIDQSLFFIITICIIKGVCAIVKNENIYQNNDRSKMLNFIGGKKHATKIQHQIPIFATYEYNLVPSQKEIDLLWGLPFFFASPAFFSDILMFFIEDSSWTSSFLAGDGDFCRVLDLQHTSHTFDSFEFRYVQCSHSQSSSFSLGFSVGEFAFETFLRGLSHCGRGLVWMSMCTSASLSDVSSSSESLLVWCLVFRKYDLEDLALRRLPTLFIDMASSSSAYFLRNPLLERAGEQSLEVGTVRLLNRGSLRRVVLCSAIARRCS